MKLKDLGWEKYQASLVQEDAFGQENIARVAVENRGSYLLYAKEGDLEGIMRGKFMNFQKMGSQYPKVGDWIVFEKIDGEQKAIIKSILPRRSKISRKKAGDDLDEQIIATNVEIVFIVQGLDGDFNLSRLERYVVMAKDGNCQPVILLNKCDVASDAQSKLEKVQAIFSEVEIFLISAKAEIGIEKVRAFVNEGISVVFVGSSGAGKSTLINKLLGAERQKVGQVRLDDSRGKHTTIKRELIMLDGGGVLIDTPGMRELGMWIAAESTIEAFEDINSLIGSCRFSDCDHEFSQGCGVVEAVRVGKIDKEGYERFLKLKNEANPLEAKEKRKAEHAKKRLLRKVIKRPEFKKKK